MIHFTKHAIGLSLLSLTVSACNKEDLRVKVPDCMEDKIRELSETRDPPGIVWEWKVDGKKYYYIRTNHADGFNYLYDTNCCVVCAPDGGITGEGDGNCPEFKGEIERTLVW